MHMLDVVIVGAGLSGLLTAYELHAAGLTVLVLDRGEPAREASWAGGGILSPLYPWRYPDPINVLARWGQRAYPALAASLLEQTGIDPEFLRCGLVMLDDDEAELACAWATHWELPCEVMINSLPDAAAACRSQSRKAVWFSSIAQVRNPRLNQALVQQLRQSGVVVRGGVRPTLVLQPGRVAGVQMGDEWVPAKFVVITAGAWTSDFHECLSHVVKIFPIKGQMLLYRCDPGQLSCIVLSAGRYLIPRRDGRVLVGSTMEDVGFNRQTTLEAYQDLSAFAHTTLPQLQKAPLEHHWAGLRPATSDGLPYIGEHPEIQGLFLNAGHFRNGVVMGPSSARLIADLVLNRPPSIDPSPYRLGR